MASTNTSRSSAATHWLRYREDQRTILFLVVLTLLDITHWQAGAGFHWLAVPTCLLVFSACVAKHNHIHLPVFRKPAANRLFNFWLGLLTGTSTTGIRAAHNQRHHRSSQSVEDFVRCSLVERQPAAIALFAFFPLVIVQTWRNRATDAAAMKVRSRGLHRLQRLEQATICFFAVAGCWLDWRQFCWVFLLPWFVGQWFLVTINLLQHDGLDAESDFLDSRNVTGRPSNWLLLNNGYHTAHHRRPALHWSLLPQCHKREVAPHLPTGFDFPSLTAMAAGWYRARRAVSSREGRALSNA